MSEAAAQDHSQTSDLDGMLARAAAKDRMHIQRHLTNADAEPDPSHAALWRRLATKLTSMAPLPVQTAGHAGVLFFVPDGKYRMQMFALEDQNDGRIAVYVPDVLQEAIKHKILKPTEENDEYPIVGSLRNTLHVELLDASNTPEPATHVKNMLGWNRKALRVTLPAVGAEGPRIDAAEALCMLAIKLREAATAAKATAPAPAAKAAPGKAPAEKAVAEKASTSDKSEKSAKSAGTGAKAGSAGRPQRKETVKRRTA
jgi:hypothetical protein